MPFGESPVFWGIVSIIVAVLWIVASACFSYFWANRKVLEHSTHPSALITEDISSIPGLAVMMQGQPIQNLTATEVIFSNAGNQPLQPSDFAKAEPLGVFTSGICYGAQVKANNPNSTPKINAVEEHILDVEFDFLKPKESITLIVWHDGDVSMRGDLISGKVREGKNKGKNTLKSISITLTVFILIFASLLTIAFSKIWGTPITDVDSFLSSPFLYFSIIISYGIILIPILIYSLIQFIEGIK